MGWARTHATQPVLIRRRVVETLHIPEPVAGSVLEAADSIWNLSGHFRYLFVEALPLGRVLRSFFAASSTMYTTGCGRITTSSIASSPSLLTRVCSSH